MKKFSIEGHTVEFRVSGSGSMSPWEYDFASSINLSLFGTADLRLFMLIDEDHVYAFDSFNDAHPMYGDKSSVLPALSDGTLINTWKEFNDLFLTPLLEQRHLRDFGSLKETIEGLKETKKRDLVWKSYPIEKRRDLYEFLKTLSKEDQNKWYQEKFKELGIS